MIASRTALCMGVVLTVCFLIRPEVARAGPYVEAQGYAQGFTGLENNITFVNGSPNGTGQLMQPSYAFVVQQQATDPPGTHNLSSASGFLKGSVSPGTIKSMAMSGSNGPTGEGFGLVSLMWGDTITPFSNSVPAGTPAMFRFTLSLSGSLGVTGDNNAASNLQDPNQATFTSALSVALPGVQPVSATGGTLGGKQLPGASTAGFPTGLYQTTGVGAVGTPFSISNFGSLDAIASSSTVSPSVTAFVDSVNTAVYIESLTPGVSFVSASGATYTPSAVPEPAGLTLVGVCASGLLALRAWRRHSKAAD